MWRVYLYSFSVEEKAEFRDILQQTYDVVREERKIVMRDMNALVGVRREGEERVLRAHSVVERNRNGEHLIDLQ